MMRSPDLARLSLDLGRISATAVPHMRRVLKKAGQNIKTDTQANMSKHPSWSHLSRSVSYDFVGLSGAAGLSLEVGYNHVGQGKLAGIYEFGSARRSPNPTLMPAFEREVPRLEKAMGDAVDRMIGGGL